MTNKAVATPLALRIPPRRCGATFGPKGLLVTFSPSMSHHELEKGAAEKASSISGDKPPSLSGSRKAITAAGPTSTTGGARPNHGGGAGAQSGGARFLQSYSALSGAMASLARLAREGMDVKDLDVMQLMGDQNFLDRRVSSADADLVTSFLDLAIPPPCRQIHRSHSKGDSSRKRGSRGTSLAPSGSRTALEAGRSASHAAGLRARSASPMPASSSRPRSALSRLGGAAVTHSHSDVRIWELRHFLPPLVAPSLVRRRSSSLPSSSPTSSSSPPTSTSPPPSPSPTSSRCPSGARLLPRRRWECRWELCSRRCSRGSRRYGSRS